MQSPQPKHKRIKYAITQVKQPERHPSVLGKRRLDQLLSTRRASSFATTNDFFEGSQAFIPSAKVVTLDRDRRPQDRKDKFRLYRNLKLPDFDSFTRLGNWAESSQKKLPAHSKYSSCPQRQNGTYLKTKSVTPERRNYLVRRVPLVAAFHREADCGEIQGRIETLDSFHSASIRRRSCKLKQRVKLRVEQEGETLTGWNSQPLYNQAEVEV